MLTRINYLLYNYKENLIWFNDKIVYFSKNVTKPFFLSIVYYCLAHIFRLLSFLLTIKIIIFISNNSSSFLTWQINLDEKSFWIIILSALTIFLLLMSFILDRQLDKISKNCTSQLFILSKKFNLTKLMKDNAQSYFNTHIKVLSNMLIFFTVVFIIGHVNILLAFTIIFLLLLMYVHVSFNLSNDYNYQNQIKNFILHKSKEYLDIWFVLIFFAIFAILVAEYLLFNTKILIFSIIILVLLRHALGLFFSALLDLIYLFKNQEKIDGLLKEGKQLPSFKKKYTILSDLNLNEIEKISKCALQKLNLSKNDPNKLKIYWLDNNSTTIMFVVETKYMLNTYKIILRIFSNHNNSLLEKEENLFNCIERDKISSPHILDSFQYKELTINILPYYSSIINNQKLYEKAKKEILKDLYSFCPPKKLIDVYASSNLLLHQKLHLNLIESLWIAVNTAEQRKLLKKFIKLLPFLKIYINNMPKFLCNSELDKYNISTSSSGNFILINWSKWSIKTLGEGKLYNKNIHLITRLLPKLVQLRTDVSEKFCDKDFMLVQLVELLIENLYLQKFNSALQIIKEIIEISEYRLVENIANQIKNKHFN